MNLEYIEKRINTDNVKYKYLPRKENELRGKIETEGRKSFEKVIEALQSGGFIKAVQQKDQEKWPDTFMLIVMVEGYIHAVPAHLDKTDNTIVLRTNYKDRKLNKEYEN